MKLYLSALGVVNPLGCGKHEVARNLFQGSRNGLVQRCDLIPDRAVRVGAVLSDLPEVPSRLAHLDSRNNRLALAALLEIEGDIKTTISRVGAHRVAVVMGTSTSGIAEGEAALALRTKNGAWPKDFSYSRQEIGSLGRFVAEYLQLTAPGTQSRRRVPRARKFSHLHNG